MLLHQFSLEQYQAMFPKRAKAKLARKLESELRAATTLAPAERDAKQRELSVQLELWWSRLRMARG